MKKVLFIAIALMASVTFSNAQVSNHFGIRAGMDISKLTGHYDVIFANTDSKVGFNAGVIDQIYFSENVPLYVETGLMFEQKGFKVKDEKLTVNSFYLQIPVVLGYSIPASDLVKVQPFAGLYYGLGIGGKVKDSSGYKVDTFGADGLKRSDFGLRVGVGVAIKCYYIGTGYENSLIKINNDEGTGRNQVFTISLGYNF
ncbi:MAG: porin family protein [Bacteroidales bacterium]|jgi:hypothetical protein|nr:porin family protein [Bacteroidales bacterium]